MDSSQLFKIGSREISVRHGCILELFLNTADVLTLHKEHKWHTRRILTFSFCATVMQFSLALVLHATLIVFDFW